MRYIELFNEEVSFYVGLFGKIHTNKKSVGRDIWQKEVVWSSKLIFKAYILFASF